MIRPRIPFRLAGATIRHRRVRRRPVALVFRRPPRTRPPAPHHEVRAGDQVSVTLAPRFTMVLQQVVRAAAVVGRPERTAPNRPSAPAVIADAGRLGIGNHGWSWGAPPLGGPVDRLIVRTSVGLRVVRQAATPQLASVDLQQAWFRPIITDPSHPGPASQPAVRRLVAPARIGERGPSWPGRADAAGELASPRRRGRRGRDSAHPPRIRRVTRDLPAQRSAAAPQRNGDRVATARPSLPPFELALGGSARSAPRREPRVAPVATVYRQEQSTKPSAPPTLPVPAVDAPAAHPAIDIDQIDRELWRRFEKRARTERERRGRA
jgi:hypothetical protein